jgi:hypothetical protein
MQTKSLLKRLAKVEARLKQVNRDPKTILRELPVIKNEDPSAMLLRAMNAGITLEELVLLSYEDDEDTLT